MYPMGVYLSRFCLAFVLVLVAKIMCQKAPFLTIYDCVIAFHSHLFLELASLPTPVILILAFSVTNMEPDKIPLKICLFINTLVKKILVCV